MQHPIMSSVTILDFMISPTPAIIIAEEELRGKLRIQSITSFHLEHLKVYFVGEEQAEVVVVGGSTTQEEERKTIIHKALIRQDITSSLDLQDIMLDDGLGGNQVVVPAGTTYEIPLCFTLPSHLPSSFSVIKLSDPGRGTAKIVYFLELLVIFDTTSHRYPLPFPLQAQPKPLKVKHAKIIPRSHNITTGLIGQQSKGRIMAGATMEDAVLIRGQNLKVNLGIVNDSTKSIHDIKLTLIEQVEWNVGEDHKRVYLRELVERQVTDISSAEQQLKKKTNLDALRAHREGDNYDNRTAPLVESQLQRSPLSILLPPVPQSANDSYESTTNLLKVTHYVKVDLNTRKYSSNPSFQIPVRIQQGPSREQQQSSTTQQTQTQQQQAQPTMETPPLAQIQQQQQQQQQAMETTTPVAVAQPLLLDIFVDDNDEEEAPYVSIRPIHQQDELVPVAIATAIAPPEESWESRMARFRFTTTTTGGEVVIANNNNINNNQPRRTAVPIMASAAVSEEAASAAHVRAAPAGEEEEQQVPQTNRSTSNINIIINNDNSTGGRSQTAAISNHPQSTTIDIARFAQSTTTPEDEEWNERMSRFRSPHHQVPVTRVPPPTTTVTRREQQVRRLQQVHQSSEPEDEREENAVSPVATTTSVTRREEQEVRRHHQQLQLSVSEREIDSRNRPATTTTRHQSTPEDDAWNLRMARFRS